MDIEDILVVAWHIVVWMFEMGERGQKIQMASYKMNKSWDCNVQYGEYT